MAYNKQYKRDSNRNGKDGKENQKPRFNIGFAIWVLVLLGLLYAVIFHGSEIKNMITEAISGSSERVENTGTVAHDVKNPKKRDITESTTIKANEKDVTIAENTETNEPEKQVPVERSEKQAATIENISVSTKSEDYSKHKFERFVDQDNGKYGVKDLTTGKVLIEPAYDRIEKVREGLQNPYIIVCRDKLWGVVNVNNEIVIPIEHTNINEYVHKRDEIYLELDKKDINGKSVEGYARMPEGKIVVPFKYGYVTRATNDYKYFEVRENTEDRNSVGIVDQNDRLILPMEYTTISTTFKADGYAIISKFYPNPDDGKTYYLNGLLRLSDGKIVVPVEYQDLEVIGPVSFIRVKKDGLYGCINDKNEVIVPFQKVTGIGSSSGSWDNSDNKVYFTLPNGESVAYNAKGQKVPVN